MGVDINSPTGASTIFKFTPDGNRIVFGSVPGQGFGLAFREGNLYAADAYDQTVYKFAPDGTRTVFVGPSAFTENAAPVGLAFDASGNLFVSTENDPGNDSILVFDTNGSERPPFATGLTTPRGLAFDSSGNLFCSRGRCTRNSGRRYLEVPCWRRPVDRFCLRLRSPGIPHLRAAAITGLDHAPRCNLFCNAAQNLRSRHRSPTNLLSSRDLIGAQTSGTNSRECTREPLRKTDTNCTNSHESSSGLPQLG